MAHLKRLLPSREMLTANAGHTDPDTAASVELLLQLLSTADNVRADVYEPMLNDHGISEGKLMMLAVLRNEGAKSVSTLAERLGVTQATVSVMLSRMEDDPEPWITRIPDPQDKRARVVKLTDTGRRGMEAIFPAHRAAVVTRLSVLSPSERDTLVALLRKLG